MKDYSRIFGRKKLILFDVDGTLVDTIGIQLDALREAYWTCAKTSFETDEEITKHFGKPARTMVPSPFLDKGKHIASKTISRILEYHQKKMKERLAKLGKENVLPGVKRLLERLRRDEKILGTITANQRETGKILIRQSGLAPYFSFHTYSDDTYTGKKISERYQLVLEAYRRAQESYPPHNQKGRPHRR
jgi:phosphoglycolate phosphatase-like HAD superfamily hydrolase